jgi:hypothetical protein
MPYIHLHAHYVHHVPGGVSVGAVGLDLQLADGTAVALPVPFVPLDDTLAVTPLIALDGAAGIRIDFTQWAPLRYGAAGNAAFPFYLPSQGLAVRVTRAFAADPATGWDDTPEAKKAWLDRWLATDGGTVAGGTGAAS